MLLQEEESVVTLEQEYIEGAVHNLTNFFNQLISPTPLILEHKYFHKSSSFVVLLNLEFLTNFRRFARSSNFCGNSAKILVLRNLDQQFFLVFAKKIYDVLK